MIDHILAMKLNHVPIYAYEVKSSDEVSLLILLLLYNNQDNKKS